MKTKPFIKICGITRIADLECVIQHGVDAVGFIAYPKSPRYISPAKVKELISQADCKNIKKVAVFVNADLKEIAEYLQAGVDAVQLHGDESEEFSKSVNAEVWKAIRLHEDKQIAEFKDYPCSKFLIDSFVKDSAIPGGTGHVANWGLAQKFIGEVNKDVLLAGGISAENLQQAIKEVSPFGLDLSSSVETEPGIKDHEKIEALFKKLELLAL